MHDVVLRRVRFAGFPIPARERLARAVWFEDGNVAVADVKAKSM